MLGSRIINLVLSLILVWQILPGRISGLKYGYEGDKGPIHWGKLYGECMGKRQSPIHIRTVDVISKLFPVLKFEHFDEPVGDVEIRNNGHSVMLKVLNSNLPTIQGGPITGTFYFAQLHFHWGRNDSIGSETRIDQRSFCLELHVVMYNNLYPYEDAVNHKDGITVLAFLMEISSNDNANYDTLAKTLRQVHDESSTSTIYNFGPLNQLLSEKRSRYFTYEGSLTTPPCSEVVTWIVFEDTLPLSRIQVKAFRSLSTHDGPLAENIRPTQPLNGRTVFYHNEATAFFQGNLLCKFAVIIIVLFLVSHNNYYDIIYICVFIYC